MNLKYYTPRGPQLPVYSELWKKLDDPIWSELHFELHGMLFMELGTQSSSIMTLSKEIETL